MENGSDTPRTVVIHSGKVTWQWTKSTICRCISYWKRWDFQLTMWVYQRLHGAVFRVPDVVFNPEKMPSPWGTVPWRRSAFVRTRGVCFFVGWLRLKGGCPKSWGWPTQGLLDQWDQWFRVNAPVFLQSLQVLNIASDLRGFSDTS